ncbi:hypothetical protein GCM10010306_062650 [Streptomyces umbrinus]|nr:hypothetical protein GCM10010306_062650 [Streptomyces umbrinus]
MTTEDTGRALEKGASGIVSARRAHPAGSVRTALTVGSAERRSPGRKRRTDRRLALGEARRTAASLLRAQRLHFTHPHPRGGAMPVGRLCDALGLDASTLDRRTARRPA